MYTLQLAICKCLNSNQNCNTKPEYKQVEPKDAPWICMPCNSTYHPATVNLCYLEFLQLEHWNMLCLLIICMSYTIFQSNLWLHKTTDKVCQWLATGRWFSPGTPVSSTNKIDSHDIAEILLKVAISTITPPIFCIKQLTTYLRSVNTDCQSRSVMICILLLHYSYLFQKKVCFL
jgi:hypothetical protein